MLNYIRHRETTQDGVLDPENPEWHQYHFTVKCPDLENEGIGKYNPNCEGEKEITVNGPDLFMYNQGALIQTAFPYLSVDDRERLLSGHCPSCWDKLFQGEE